MKIALATCVSVSACSTPNEASVRQNDVNRVSLSERTTVQHLTTPTPIHRKSWEGQQYEWGKDHIFVKLSSAETGGALTLIQDNLKLGFNLGRHLHRKHSEIFYILDGEIDFLLGERPLTATAGSVVYVPEGTAHAAKSSKGGRMLMFYTPGGFDEMLTEIDNASWLQRVNPFVSARRNAKYDIREVHDGERVNKIGPMPRYLAPKEGAKRSSGSTMKLSSSETKGLGVLTEQTLPREGEYTPQLQSKQSEILYILVGDVEFAIDGRQISATAGSTIYFPPGTESLIKAVTNVKLLVFRTPG